MQYFSTNRKSAHASFREAVLRGEVVCIFAEGALTRTGQLQPFQRGLMRIVAGTEAPIIPVYRTKAFRAVKPWVKDLYLQPILSVVHFRNVKIAPRD